MLYFCPVVKFGYNSRLIIVCRWFKSSRDNNLLTVGLMEMIRDYESRDIGSIPIRSIFGDVMQTGIAARL